MSGRGFVDYQDVGIFPLQDHEPNVPTHVRQMIAGARVRRIQNPGESAGYVEIAEDRQHGTIGDIHPWLFWQTADKGLRGTGAWSMVFPALAVNGGMGFSGTSAGPGGTQFLPVRYRTFDSDGRFYEVTPGQPTGFPSVPRGSIMLLASGMEEQAQQTVGMHVDPRLIAPHVDGPGDAGTLVCDLQGRGEICMDGSLYPGVGGRHARLQTMMRVIALPDRGIPLLGTGPGNSVAWNMAGTQQEGLAGYGLCYARIEGKSGPITSHPPVTKRLPTPITPNGAGEGDSGPLGLGSPGTGEDGRTPRSFGQFRPAAQKAHGCMVLSATASGPLHAGSSGDQHQIGVDADGHPINAGHISTGAYFYGSSQRDGPLLFEGLYPDPPPLPLKSRVHLTWDPKLRHPFIGGPRNGMWRWYAEYHVVVPEPGDKVPTTPRTGKGKTGTPSTPSTPSRPTPGTGTPRIPKTPGPGTPSTPSPGVPSTPTPPSTGKGRLPTPITPQPRNPHPRSPSRQDPTTPYPAPPNGPREPKDPTKSTPITPYPQPPQTPTEPSGPFGPGDLIRPGDELERYYTEPRDHAIGRMKAAAPDPTGSKVIVGDLSSEDVGLYSLHHPFAESFSELSFRPQLMVDGYPSFVHNGQADGDFVEADEGVKPHVLSGRSWGAQNADGEWAYTESPRISRARGGTAPGGFLLTPPAFELEDYFGLGSNLDVTSPTTQSYFAFAPGVALAFGLPNLDGGLEAKSIVFEQDETHANFKTYIRQLDSSRVGQTLIDLELDQSGSEVVVGVGGEQALRLPRGTQAQRQANITLVGGELRCVTDGGTDHIEYYDAQNSTWRQLDTATGGVTDHGALTGLADDDHTQYHNDTRGDARYYTKTLLGSVSTGEGASLIGIEDSGGLITATTVEGALQELAAASGTTFLSLTDTPSAYTSSGGYAVKVNSGATALEFVDLDTLYTLTTTLAGTGGAGGVGILDAGAYYTGGTVEAALQEAGADIATNAATFASYTLTTDLASTATGKGASLIGIEDSGGLITATTVEGALQELAAGAGTNFLSLTDTPSVYTSSGGYAVKVNSGATALEFVDLDTLYTLTTDLASTAVSKGASLIGINDAGALIIATTVEAALQELATNIDNNTTAISTNQSDIGTNATNIATNTSTFGNYTTTADLASTGFGKGASLIGVQDPGFYWTATTVETVMAEIQQSLDTEEAALVTHKSSTDHDSRYTTTADLGSAAVGKGASLIGVEDAATNYTGTNVETVLAEISTYIDANTTAISTNQTDIATNAATFASYTTTNDLASTANGKGASLIGVQDPGFYWSATTVETVMAEIQQSLNTEEAALVTHKSSADHDSRYTTTATLAGTSGAGGIGILDSGAYYTGGTVEAALQEIGADFANYLPLAGGTMTGSPVLTNNVLLKLGTGGNSTIKYDGTNTIWDPKAIGSGYLRINGKVGVNVAPSEDIHANGKIRADAVFNCAGNDGYDTVGVGSDIVFVDGESNTHTITIRGGIITDWVIA